MEKPKPSLADFQQWMQQQLLDPSGQLKTEGQATFAVEDIIKPSSRLAAHQHLAIYQHGYTARLRSCMAKQFTALEYALGEDLFRAFADEYLKVYPSEHYNLAQLGDRFAAYLAETRPDKRSEEKEDWPDFMIELAQFECAINHIFDEEVSGDYELATAATPNGQLKLVPGLYLFAFKFPIRWFYSAFNQGEEPELPLPQPTYCIVRRKSYQLEMFDLQAGQYSLLSYLRSGYRLPATLGLLAQASDFSSEEWKKSWVGWRDNWLKAGFFSF